MFFKIYFSRRKFEQDAAALVQKQNGWAANNIGEVLGDLKTAREELLGLDTWDKYKKLRIDSNLKTVKDFLEKLVWKPVKRKEDQ